MESQKPEKKENLPVVVSALRSSHLGSTPGNSQQFLFVVRISVAQSTDVGIQFKGSQEARKPKQNISQLLTGGVAQ
jgi:hypothetical protein